MIGAQRKRLSCAFMFCNWMLWPLIQFSMILFYGLIAALRRIELQASTSHQELPTRTHPDHCSDGSQQPDCHKARLLQQPSGRLHQTLDKLQRVLNCSARVIFGGDSHQHVTPYSAIIFTGCGQGNASRSNSAYWCTRQCTTWHHVISTRCAFQFRLFPTFLLSVSLFVVIWSDTQQKKHKK